MNKSSWFGATIGALGAIPTVAISIWAAAAGHGSYWPAVVLFPFTMLSTGITSTISPFAITLALLQFPIYGFVLGGASVPRLRLGTALAIVHSLGVIAAVVMLKGRAFI